MNLIDIAYPTGTLTAEQRHDIARSILDNLLVEPNAPAEAIRRAGTLTHVWFHAGQTWTTGAGPYTDGPIPLVATITVPEAWRAEMARHAISAVRVALARHLPDAVGAAGGLWINVIGVPDGCLGMNGKACDSSDIVRFLTRDLDIPEPAGLPDDVVIDPVCGMRVHLGKSAITLDHDGRTTGFCAAGCRDVYIQDHAP